MILDEKSNIYPKLSKTMAIQKIRFTTTILFFFNLITYAQDSPSSSVITEFTASNSNVKSAGVMNLIPDPIFSKQGGFSTSSHLLQLSSTLDSVSIYYTTDGSIPTENDSLYTLPLTISATSVIRAKGFRNGYLPSSTVTNTYFINEGSVLPVISIATNPDNIDLIEISKTITANYGDRISYDNLINFVSTKDMSLNVNYEYVKTVVDIDEYINYLIAEIYSANADWPGSNVKLWRPRSPEGKWRWMIYDLDFGFGGNGQGQYFSNTLELATAANGPDWPNPPWSTLLFRKMLLNKNFKNEFIQRFAVHMNTTFDSTKVISIIDSMQTNIAPEIPRHKIKWPKSVSYGLWDDLVEIMREFARQRPAYVNQHFEQKFGLSGKAALTINNNNSQGGKIIAHTVEIPGNNYRLTLFKDVPVNLNAQPFPGYRFAGWQGLVNDSSGTIFFYLTENSQITALFEKDSSQATNVLFNEINYNSSSIFDTGDWLELYNNTDSPIDISGWVFKDEENLHGFIFPNNTFIGARDYLVICRNITTFNYFFPAVNNIMGDFDFGLSGDGELIRLFDNQANIIDSLTYKKDPPWPAAASGGGSTLELIHPNLDNSLSGNWNASPGHGSPGTINGTYTEIEQNSDNFFPAEFSLEQNYPNPFNPTTTINYQLKTESNVQLIIYDSSGREIKTLINQVQNAGIHSVTFDASDLASGIYIYLLKAGSFKQSRKMILLR